MLLPEPNPKRPYDYRPGKSLLNEIKEYSGRRGERCSFVDCAYRRPDYSVLTRRQIAYYLYWRGNHMKTRLESRGGYAWLRVCELINSSSDSEVILEELRFLSNPENDRDCANVAWKPYIDYSILHTGKPSTPKCSYWSGYRPIVACELVSNYLSGYSFSEVLYFTDYFDCYSDIDVGSDRDRFCNLLSGTISRIDGILRKESGKGILETYGRYVETVLDLFEDFVHVGKDSVRISYYDIFTPRGTDFMQGLIRYCERKVTGCRTVRSTSSFGPRMRKVADDIYHEIELGIYTQWKPTQTHFRVIPDEEVKVRRDGIIHPVEGPALDITGMKLRKDMADNWKIDSDEVLEYVPSTGRVCTWDMDESQKRYYISWRTGVRNGYYGDTDQGYIWLFVSELINNAKDPAIALGWISGLITRYQTNNDLRPYLKKAYTHYARREFLEDLVDTDVVLSEYTLYIALENLFSGRRESISTPAAAVLLAELRENSMVVDVDRDCATIFFDVLKRMDKELPEGLFKHYGLRPSLYRDKLFDGFAYYPDNGERNTQLAYLGLYRASFVDDMNMILKDVIRHVRIRQGRRNQRPMVAMMHGMNVCMIIMDAVDDFYTARRPPVPEVPEPAPKVRVKLELDRDAVNTAQSDLDTVTDIMKVDEIDCEPPVENAEQEAPGDVGEESFTTPEKEFLQLLLEKRQTRPFLLEHGIEESVITESINSKALALIGDVAIEDGTVIEEYVDDIRKMIG